jgi:hypothetical protein
MLTLMLTVGTLLLPSGTKLQVLMLTLSMIDALTLPTVAWARPCIQCTNAVTNIAWQLNMIVSIRQLDNRPGARDNAIDWIVIQLSTAAAKNRHERQLLGSFLAFPGRDAATR